MDEAEGEEVSSRWNGACDLEGGPLRAVTVAPPWGRSVSLGPGHQEARVSGAARAATCSPRSLTKTAAPRKGGI